MKNIFKNFFFKEDKKITPVKEYKPLEKHLAADTVNISQSEISKMNNLIVQVSKDSQNVRTDLIGYVAPFISKVDTIQADLLKLNAEVKNISNGLSSLQEMVKGLLQRETENKVQIMANTQATVDAGVKKATSLVQTTADFSNNVESMRQLMKSQAEDARNAKELIAKVVEQFGEQKQIVAQQVASFDSKVQENLRKVTNEFETKLKQTLEELKKPVQVIEKVIERVVPVTPTVNVTPEGFGASITKSFREDVEKREIPIAQVEPVKYTQPEIVGNETTIHKSRKD